MMFFGIEADIVDSFKLFPYEVKRKEVEDEDTLDEDPAYIWCVENFGKNMFSLTPVKRYGKNRGKFQRINKNAVWEWNHNSDSFIFKNKEDAMRFKLIFGGAPMEEI